MSSGQQRYVLAWEVSGRSVKHVIRGDELFVGRLPHNLSSVVKEYSQFMVYIYYPSSNSAYPTGHESLTVSRLHAKLSIKGGKVLIKDHGPEGTGSKNGLVVNGIRLPRGGSAELTAGSSFKLGCLGPMFTLLAETPSGVAVSLEEGVPTYLPKSLAKDLSKGGHIKVLYVVGGEAVVLPVSIGEYRLGNYVIKTEKVSSKDRVSKILFKMHCRVSEAIDLINQGEVEKSAEVVKELGLDVFSKTIEGLGDEKLKEEYKWLLKQVSSTAYLDESSLLSRLRRFRKMLEDIIDVST